MSLFKGEMGEILRYLEHLPGKTSTKITLGTTATSEQVYSQEPDLVIIVLGSKPILPNIPGTDLPFVFDVRAVYVLGTAFRSGTEVGLQI